MADSNTITSPDSDGLDALCESLARLAPGLETPGAWPGEQLTLCAEAGVFRWFVPEVYGGYEWSGEDIVRGHLRLSRACLTTTFVLTQLTGALRRLAASDNETLRDHLLPELLTGQSLATLGISHLTTSRQHLGRPALVATATDDGYKLDGLSPWVTGASETQYIITGASLEDGRQLLAVVPTNREGVEIPAPAELVALTASRTGAARFNQVTLAEEWIMAGPMEHVIKNAIGARTGGLQTSTLAIGLAWAAIELMETEAEKRKDLMAPAHELRAELQSAENILIRLAAGEPAELDSAELRAKSNSLVLRCTQAALAAAKGAGYVAGHPAGRWCRQALFFLVWSCPQAVMSANLCEFAGIQAN
jgi:alkylation response protein AidB-like acyl-CoA dehydrogenase